MDIRASYGLPTSLAWTPPSKLQTTLPTVLRQQTDPSIRTLYLTPQSLTRLIDESREDTESGHRRTLIYEQPDGRRFTRIEDISLYSQGARRAVVQQKPLWGNYAI